MAETPFLVPNVLLLAVPLYGGRALLAIPPPVIRIPSTPLLRTIPVTPAKSSVTLDFCSPDPRSACTKKERLPKEPFLGGRFRLDQTRLRYSPVARSL